MLASSGVRIGGSSGARIGGCSGVRCRAGLALDSTMPQDYIIVPLVD